MSEEKKPEPLSIEAGGIAFNHLPLPDGLALALAELPCTEKNMSLIEVRVTAAQPTKPEKLDLKWRIPTDGVHYKWGPSCFRHRMLDTTNDCRNKVTSQANSSAPLSSVYDIEFRQDYTGPIMYRYANMMRAVDCGNCFADNRARVLDVRMLSGKTPAFADPIMWNPAERVESAALQCIHALYSVPEISVKLDELPQEHTDMLRQYLAFWRKHSDVILDGELTPLEPHNFFPLVLSETTDKFLAAVYANTVVTLPPKPPDTLLLVNGTYAESIVVDVPSEAGTFALSTVTCTGKDVGELHIKLSAGLHKITVPPCGYATLIRVTR